MRARPTLLLVYETERSCRERLGAEGFAEPELTQVGSYLAQSSDILDDLAAITEACQARDLAFEPLALDDAPARLATADPASTLVWTLTDGIAYYRGGVVPALARLHGLKRFGADDALFALCQDKFRSGAVLRALGLPAPEAGIARDGRWLVAPPPSPSGWFVKPNRLGSKIGIWDDSRCDTLEQALDLSRRIHLAYRDDAIVQPYLPGRNARASYLAVLPGSGMDVLGIAFVESGAEFQTMDDSLALYGRTGVEARMRGEGDAPGLVAVEAVQPRAAAAARAVAAALVDLLDLRDVFSLDFRIEEDGALHLIEFEVCPGLPCFDFRDYCRTVWNMSLAEAMAAAAGSRLRPGPAISRSAPCRSWCDRP